MEISMQPNINVLLFQINFLLTKPASISLAVSIRKSTLKSIIYNLFLAFYSLLFMFETQSEWIIFFFFCVFCKDQQAFAYARYSCYLQRLFFKDSHISPFYHDVKQSSPKIHRKKKKRLIVLYTETVVYFHMIDIKQSHQQKCQLHVIGYFVFDVSI